MNIVKNFLLAISLVALTGITNKSSAAEIIKKDDFSLNLGGRFQLFGLGERVSDPYKTNERMFLFLKQARLMTYGQIEDYKYYAEWAMGGEEAVKNLNSSTSLLDYRADIPVIDQIYLRMGQFKVPFGREALTNDGFQSFSDRSINNLIGQLGRDVGGALVYQNNGIMGTFGVFTGGGRDNPERYLPEELGTPLYVVRAGYDSNGEDPYDYKNTGNFEKPDNSFAAFVNASYLEDSKVGHSTVLNVKSVDKSLLLNPNWNPYLAMTPYSRSHVLQVGADLQKRFMISNANALFEVEYTHGEFANDYGTLGVNGGRALVSALWNPFEVALRYAVVYPTHDFKYSGVVLTGDDPFREVAMAFTFYHRPWSRFSFEGVVHLETPVVIEPNVGAYVLAEQPDQVTVVKAPTNGYIERQYVPEVKFLYQLTF